MTKIVYFDFENYKTEAELVDYVKAVNDRLIRSGFSGEDRRIIMFRCFRIDTRVSDSEIKDKIQRLILTEKG